MARKKGKTEVWVQRWEEYVDFDVGNVKRLVRS